MPENKQYRCVNCGKPHSALYKTYGPSVLKLTKCDKCKGIVDKYIEYDPVIVMIDIVLISKEAQRHVLYNTEFKSYWKLFIILVMVETYGLWRRDSLFNIAIDSFCVVQNGSDYNTFLQPLAALFADKCGQWGGAARGGRDLFIMEKDFYVQFVATFSGIVMFLLTLHGLMKLMKSGSSRYEVPVLLLVKGFSLANTSVLFSLPALVWSPPASPPHSRAAHYLLALGYSCCVMGSVFRVLYERPLPATVLALSASVCVKFVACYHVSPALRDYIL